MSASEQGDSGDEESRPSFRTKDGTLQYEPPKAMNPSQLKTLWKAAKPAAATSQVTTRQTRSNSGARPSVYSPSRRDTAPQAIEQAGPVARPSIRPSAHPNNARSLGPDFAIPSWLSNVPTGLPTIREATIEPPTSVSRTGISAAPSFTEDPVSDAESATVGSSSIFQRRGKPVSKLKSRLKGATSAETAPSSPARRMKAAALSGASKSLAGIAVPRPAGVNAINKIRARAPEPEISSSAAGTPKQKKRKAIVENPIPTERTSSAAPSDEVARSSAKRKAGEPVEAFSDPVNPESVRPIKRPTPSRSKAAEFAMPKLPLTAVVEKAPAPVDQSLDGDMTLVANEVASPAPAIHKATATLPFKAVEQQNDSSVQSIVKAPAGQQSLPLQLRPHKPPFSFASTATQPSAQAGESAKQAMVVRNPEQTMKQARFENTILDLTGLDKLIVELPQLRNSMQSRQMEVSAAQGQVEDLQTRISVHRDEITKLRASKAKYKQKTLDLEMVRVEKAKLEGQLERLKLQKAHSEANAATLEAQNREAHAKAIETLKNFFSAQPLRISAEMQNAFESATSIPSSKTAEAANQVVKVIEVFLHELQQLHTAEIRRVEEALDQREEVTRLTQELAEAQQAATSAKADLFTSEAAKREATAEKKRFAATVSELESKVTQAETTHAAKVATLVEKLDKGLAHFESQVATIEAESVTWRADALKREQAHENILVAKDDTITRLTEEKTRYKAEAEASSKRCTELQTQKDVADEKVLELEASRKALCDGSAIELHAHEDQMRKAEDERFELERENTIHKTERNLYEIQLVAIRAELDQCKSALFEAQTGGTSGRDAHECLIAAARSAHAKLLSVLEWTDTTNQASNDLSILASELSQHAERVANVVSESRAERSNLESLLKQAREEVIAGEKKAIETQAQLDKQASAAVLLQKHLDSLQASHDALLASDKSQLQALTERHESLTADKEQLQKTLAFTTAEVTSLREQKIEHRAESERQQGEISDLTAQLLSTQSTMSSAAATAAAQNQNLEAIVLETRAAKQQAEVSHTEVVNGLQSDVRGVREKLAAKESECKYLLSQTECLTSTTSEIRAALHQAQTAEAVALSQKQALVDALEAKETELVLRKDQWATIQVLEAAKKKLEEDLQAALQAASRRNTPVPEDRSLEQEAEHAETKKQLAASQAEIANLKQRMQIAAKSVQEQHRRDMAQKDNQIKRLQSKLDEATTRKSSLLERLDKRADTLLGAISASQKPAGRPSRPTIPQDSSDPPSVSGDTPVSTDPKADKKNLGTAAPVNRIKQAAVGGATVNRKKATVQEQDRTQLTMAEVKSQPTALKQVDQHQSNADPGTRDRVRLQEVQIANTSHARTVQQNTMQAEERSSSSGTPRATRSSSRKASSVMPNKKSPPGDQDDSGSDSQAKKKQRHN